MKLFVYLISFVLTLALIGLFVIKKPDGQAWLTIDDLLPEPLLLEQEIESIADKLEVTYENISSSLNSHTEKEAEVKVYRWKDNNGNWSYSDKPRASAESEEIFIDPNDVVVLPAFKASSNDSSMLNSSKVNSSRKDEKTSPLPLTTPPTKVLDLYKDANNVQKLMNERQQNISKAIKDKTS